MENPYQAPSSVIKDVAPQSPSIQDIETGQKRVIYATLLYILTGAVSVIGENNPIAGLLALVIAVAFLFLGWTGIYRISRGLGHSMISRILIMLLMLVPLIGLITLLVTNAKATRALKNSGYSVGLLGARKKQG